MSPVALYTKKPSSHPITRITAMIYKILLMMIVLRLKKYTKEVEKICQFLLMLNFQKRTWKKFV